MSAVDPTDLQLAAADELSDLTADLVELARHEPLLHRLFAQAAGSWVELAALLDHDAELRAHLRTLEAAAEDQLRVTWLPAADGSGLSVIVFFLQAIHWHSLALYNRARLLA